MSPSTSSSLACRTFAKSGQCPNGKNCFLSHDTLLSAPRTQQASTPSWRSWRSPEASEFVSNASLVQMQASQRRSSRVPPPPPHVRSNTIVSTATGRSTNLTDRIWDQPAPSLAAATPAGSRFADRFAPQRLGSRQTSTASSVPPGKNDLYKTELCRSWSQSNACPYGIKCQFAHGSQELRSVQRHRNYKTVECNQFAATGMCTFGSRCVFIHNDVEKRNKQAHVTDQQPTSTPAVRNFDISSWIVSDQATPYVAPSENTSSSTATRTLPLNKPYRPFMRSQGGDNTDDLIKRIETSFPMFGGILAKARTASTESNVQQQGTTTLPAPL